MAKFGKNPSLVEREQSRWITPMSDAPQWNAALDPRFGVLTPLIFAPEGDRAQAGCMNVVVAGGGIEPPTCGL